MGKKRKQEKSEEEIRRKIKKLQDKLPRTSDCLLEENFTYQPSGSTPAEAYYCESHVLLDTAQDGVISPLSPSPPSPSPPSPKPPSPLPAFAHDSSQPVSSEQPQVHELELDDEVLMLLGDAPKPETPMGPPIHKDVAQRWQDILAKGLPKDIKEGISKNYLVPINCDMLQAPALNPEVKAALPDSLVKRDSSLIYKQKQLGIALSALSNVMEMVISNETSKQKMLKPLSDACRMLCDSHHSETRIRRSYVISAINAKLKNALIESPRDKLLFGENISDKLKAAKSIQQSGEALKNVQKQKFQRTNVPLTSVNKGRLNYVPQHRKTDSKPSDSRRATNISQRQVQNTARRPSDRPFPAKNQAAYRK